MGGRSAARAAVAAVAVVALSGCWSQVGANAGRTRHNAVEDVVTAANVATLSQVWSVELEGAMREPVTAGGRVHVGSTGGPVDAFVRVDTFDLRTGALRWGRRLASGADSFMLENSGVALSGPDLWAGYLLAANETSGECPIATLRLDPATGATTSSECDVFSTVPATAAGSIAVNAVVAPGEARLRVIDAETGEVRFTGQTAVSPTIPPLIGGGQVVVVDRTSVAAYPLAGCGAPECAPTWRMDPTAMLGGVSVTDALVAPDGNVYVTLDLLSGGGSRVMAFSAAGQFRWLSVFDQVRDVALAGDTLYAAITHLGDDGVVALDAGGCGISQWCGTIRGYPMAGGARGLAVAGGVVYTGGNGAVVAFPEDCATSSCPPLAEVAVAGRVDHVVVSDGHVLTGSIRDDGTQVLTALAPG